MRRFATLLVALGALLLVTASPAFASELALKETFGSAAQPKLTSPVGMTVDPASGDLYVIDATKHTLNRFKANGEPDPFSALSGSNVIDGKGGKDATPQEEILSYELAAAVETEVAVAPPSAGATAGYIYVTDASNLVIDVFAPSGEYKGQEEFGYPCGVAVDSAGKVYVGSYEGEEAVYKMSSTASGELNEVAQFETETPCQVAAGAGPSAGYIFVANYGLEVTKMDASTGAVKYAVYSGGTARGISVDPTSGYLYVANGASGSAKVTAYDASGAGSASEVTSTSLGGGAAAGVAVNGTSHDVYATGSTTLVSSEQVAVLNTPNFTLNVEEGEGTVVSNPAGLSCTKAAPGSCVALFAEGKVTLTASPAPGYLVKSWKGCDSGGVNGRQCTVTQGATLKTVGVKFYKVFSLAGSKTGGLGIMGTTPGGINCSYACNSSTALYKEGSLTVKAKPAKHFHFVKFQGGTGSAASCNGVTSETCTISTFNSNSAIEEVYAEDAKNTLTLTKSGGGQGFVKTKPTNVNCGLTCTAAKAEFFASESPEVSVTLGKGTTQVTWTSGAGTCTGHATSCSVPMSSSHSLVAEFS